MKWAWLCEIFGCLWITEDEDAEVKFEIETGYSLWIGRCALCGEKHSENDRG